MSKSIEIKVVIEPTSDEGFNGAIPTASRALDAIIEMTEGDTGYRTIKIHPQVCLDELASKIQDHFTDDVEIRTGVTGGCYGARDGNDKEGLTLWLESTLWPERWLDSEGDEIVNIEKLFYEYAKELEGLDAEAFEDSMEALGIEAKMDNTYNYLGHDEHTPCDFQHVDYRLYEQNDGAVVVAKFHYGGDPRGNYTDYKVFKFNCIDDTYTVLSPSLELKEVN